LLYNVLKFIEWQPPLSERKIKNIKLCLLGGDSFNGVLDQLHGRSAQQVPVIISTVTELVKPEECNVIFIPRSREGKLAEILAGLRGHPVLTVSNINGFSKRGGMVEFSVGTDSRIHFYLNQKTVTDSGLKIQAPLLRLAKAEIAP
jgi:hypothetical protein